MNEKTKKILCDILLFVFANVLIFAMCVFITSVVCYAWEFAGSYSTLKAFSLYLMYWYMDFATYRGKKKG